MGEATRWAADELLADKEFMLKVTKFHAQALEWCSEELQGDLDIVLTAITEGKDSGHSVSKVRGGLN